MDAVVFRREFYELLARDKNLCGEVCFAVFRRFSDLEFEPPKDAGAAAVFSLLCGAIERCQSAYLKRQKSGLANINKRWGKSENKREQPEGVILHDEGYDLAKFGA